MVSVDIFESAALPYDRLMPYRRDLYGPGQHDAALSFTDRDFSRFTDFLRNVLGDETDGLAVSQLYRALEAADGKALAKAGDLVTASLQDHFDRRDLSLSFEGWAKGYEAGDRSIALFLALAAQVHPYSKVSE